MQAFFRAFAAPAALLLSLSAACGDDERPPAGLGGGAKAGSGGTPSVAGEGGGAGAGHAGSAAAGEGGEAGRDAGGGASSDAGGAGSGEGGGPAGEGGAAGGGAVGGVAASSGSGGSAPSFDCEDNGAELPVDYDPLCDPNARWGEGESVPLPVSGTDMLASVTADELSIAWSAEAGFGIAYFVADRASASDDFGTPQHLDDEAFAPAQKLALSPDGLRVLASVDGLLLVATRAARGDAFGPLEPGECAEIDALAEAGGQILGDPVIAPDDLTLYYSILSGASEATLHVSTRTGGEPWPPGVPLTECELDRHELGVRQPTGVSADGLTLFFFDSARGLSRAAFRSALDAPFAAFVDLPGYAPQPNAACDRLYYSGPTELPLGVVFSERE
jgi:hypothetical protein